MRTNFGFCKKTVLALACGWALVQSAPVAEAKKKQTGDSGVEKELRFKHGDETGNEVRALKTELLVIKSEKLALEQLQKLVKKHQGTRMEPEMLFRLAELYMRRARSERFFEVHRNSEQVMSFVPQLVKQASEAGEIRKAIAIYAKIQEKFPNFRAMDTVYFNNAYAYQQVGEHKSAEQLYVKLVERFPRSPLIPDAYLAIGEINYNGRNFTLALENFKAIRKYPKARAYPYGLYKAAWCHYNLQDTESALKQLEEVVKFGRKVAAEKLDSKLDLRKEALNDMALFFSDVKTSGEAVTYFMAQAQELDASPYVMRVVELYKRHSKFGDVETILRELLAKMPNSEAAGTVHEELVMNYDRVKRHAQGVAQLAEFQTYCETKVAEYKAKLKKNVIPQRLACQDTISATSKKLSTKWHAYWKKAGGVDGGSSNETLSASTEKAYRLYLKSTDAGDPDLPMTHFAFAELTFARGQHREASTHYAMIDGYQKSGIKIDPKIGHDAAYGAIVGLEKAVGDKWSDEDEKTFIRLSEVYVNRHASGAYVLDVRFKRAFIAYEKERYDEAAPQLKKIGWMETAAGQQTPAKVLKAQDLYLDILNIKKDFKTLREAAQSLLAVQSGEGARKTQIEKIYREAYFAEIQLLEEKGELAAAVDAYKKFALENSSSELAAKAWWNASQIQFRMGDATGGANTCYQMHKLFPQSPNGKDCLTKAAQTFESMGRLDLAAKVLLNLALVETDKQNKWREVAADFFAMSGAKDRAIVMYQKLAEGGAKGQAQIALLEKAAHLARESGDGKVLAQLEAQFSKMGLEPHTSRLVVEQAEDAFAKGDHTKAFSLSKRVIARDSLPKELLARARFVQARILEDEYRKQSVKARVERIGMVLAMKTEKLEKAQKAFQSAIKYGDPGVSVKALRRLAESYVDYAKTVRGMELPASVGEADRKAFKAEIEQLSVPMEEKGIETMAQALETAKKSSLRGGEIAELQSELNRLNMKAPAPTIQIEKPDHYLPKFSNQMPTQAWIGGMQ